MVNSLARMHIKDNQHFSIVEDEGFREYSRDFQPLFKLPSSCLTVHWVDEMCVLRNKIPNFCPITNHKGVTIRKVIYKCLQNWGIEKVFIVSVDNASSNDGAIRCYAHIINLVVRDELEEHFSSITKI
uniref:hAT-like transposase RNase-H fold domain-containing protein n=1 Tax=Lactuca sativa TaxID=4236 RepID=A0A9R1XE00_LACSA|nr:hypothetical protein LSAT_V11C400209770 [Lactuca sativa]